MSSTPNRHRPSNQQSRKGLALLLCLFVMVVTSLVLVGLTESLTSRQASYRNTNAYEKALYLAGAGIHHGMTELNTDPTWRGTLSNVELPAGSGDTYSVSAADGTGKTIVLSAEGSSESVVRRLEVTINTNG